MSNFNPELFQCTMCESKLKSAYPGQFVGCECGQSFVDQTVHYGRYGGSVRAVSDLILEDLKAITGLGYEKDDVMAILEDMAFEVFIPSYNVQAMISAQYEISLSDLGGSSLKELVEAGRGHKVIEYLQTKKEGY
jgi:hypothetical protein